ncbi:MAG: Gfo/Idh/MocA family oxidoreductase [Clostridia bacterium]|nr:Gfo/Idh/MocA family oxidoreductase [Clostridia bacterium]
MINFAIIGRNFVVDEMIASMRLFDEISLKALYSRNSETGNEYAKKQNIEKVYTSLEELAEDKDIHAVYIASPNYCHESHTLKMLEAGKHVFCEKPINKSFSGAKRMTDTAEKNGVVFMEAMMSAHVPGTEKIRELLSQIGTVRRVNLSFCQYSSRYDKFKAGIVENAFDPILENGSFMDLGVYPVHLLLNLFGMPEKIDAKALFLPMSIDGQGSMLCNYPDFQAILTWSKITQGYLPSEIQGENGSILIDKVSKPTVITLIPGNGERKEFETLFGKPVMYYEIKDFIAQINGEKMPRFNELSLMEAALMESAREKMGIDFVPKA